MIQFLLILGIPHGGVGGWVGEDGTGWVCEWMGMELGGGNPYACVHTYMHA